MAGVPLYFDRECQAYRVRPGFKFPVIQVDGGQERRDLTLILATARRVIANAEKLTEALKQLCSFLEGQDQDRT
jgi:hypothetical protein